MCIEHWLRLHMRQGPCAEYGNYKSDPAIQVDAPLHLIKTRPTSAPAVADAYGMATLKVEGAARQLFERDRDSGTKKNFSFRNRLYLSNCVFFFGGFKRTG
jgi:hypothetical protein